MRFLIVLFLCQFLFAAPVVADEFSPEDMAKIRSAESYLNSISTLTSSFTQVSPYSSVGSSTTTISYGNLFLSRPGKALWEYTDPVPQTVLIKDNKIVYHDKELDQVTYVDIDPGLSSFLMNNSVDFSSGKFKLTDFHEDEHGFSFVLQDEKEKEGDTILTEQLRLTFLNDPLRLSMFNFKDMGGKITTVEFDNIVIGASIDEEKFEFKNPKIGKDAWEKK